MEKCIQSLLKGGDRVEIIVIDDGSTDNTGAIADRYAASHPGTVIAVHQENGGHGEGINQGLRHATGSYFKVVDSDDWVSEDFPLFLDTLEQCQESGGVDLFVTNYYYEHADGKGNRSICYSNVLPEGRIFGWKDTGRFRLHQMLTIHSCTFRTELLRGFTNPLPRKVFYEDNLMVYQGLPYVSKIYYQNIDLYRYFIGRDGQSVQRDVMTRRYQHQLQVTEQCFTTCHLDEITDATQKRYLKHELFMMFGISVLYARLNKSAEADKNLNIMWKNCRAFDAKWEKRFRVQSPLCLACLPGKPGQDISSAVYSLANKIVKFN